MLSFGVVSKKISVIVKKISQIVFPFLVMYLCEISFIFFIYFNQKNSLQQTEYGSRYKNLAVSYYVRS